MPRLLTPGGVCSKLGPYPRVETPSTIWFSTRSGSGSSAWKRATLGSVTSWPDLLLTLGRLRPIRRPPKGSSVSVVPQRWLVRSSLCFPFGPAIAVASASNTSFSAASPTSWTQAIRSCFATAIPATIGISS